MLRLAAGLLLIVSSSAFAVEPDDVPCIIRVECHGRLRHGVVAIGAETTGTTITFDRITWELRLPDEAARKFAAQNHKKPIVVVGTLRCVAGTERRIRWIVDVDKLAEGTQNEGAKIAAVGLLQEASDDDGSAHYVFAANGVAWPLDLSSDKSIPDRARSLVKKLVIVAGRIERIPGADSPARLRIVVTKLGETKDPVKLGATKKSIN